MQSRSQRASKYTLSGTPRQQLDRLLLVPATGSESWLMLSLPSHCVRRALGTTSAPVVSSRLQTYHTTGGIRNLCKVNERTTKNRSQVERTVVLIPLCVYLQVKPTSLNFPCATRVTATQIQRCTFSRPSSKFTIELNGKGGTNTTHTFLLHVLTRAALSKWGRLCSKLLPQKRNSFAQAKCRSYPQSNVALTN